MYRSLNGQQCFLDDPCVFNGVKLDESNRWVQLGKAIPWGKFEKEYASTFRDAARGRPAKSARMALGILLIKERYNFSDGDTLREVQMNPYLQHFIGLTEFTHRAPFDQSSMTRFRKRVKPDTISQLNGYVSSINV
jgi:hypothetical protein